MFLRVAEFHRVFGQYIGVSPALPEQHIRDLRHRLLKEELDEFCEAFQADDLVEMADALADMAYIIAGTCVSYGIALDRKFESPYEGVFDQVDLFLYTPLDRLLSKHFTSYELGETANNLLEIQEELMWFLLTIFGVALHLGIPLNTVFAEVHRSNLSKCMPDGSVKYRSDGKILKPDTWSPPDIRGVLNKGLNKGTIYLTPSMRK